MTETDKQQNKESGKIRIKDVARLAGVSVGTVDRVLHGRPNVSSAAKEKVEKALKEMDYQPNVYASALAYNKSYTFYCIIPKHASEAYWEEIEEGAMEACVHRRDFNIQVKMLYYRRFHVDTFVKVTEQCLKEKVDGVIVVPSRLDVTRTFTDVLHERNIPFILLDSYMPDLKPLSFYGQDSFCSGYFAGRMLMMVAAKEKEIMIMKQMRNGNVASKQQENRETGFRHGTSMLRYWRISSKATNMSTTVSPSTRRLISWASSCRAATAEMCRLWAMTWWRRMPAVSDRAPSRFSSLSMPTCRAIRVWRRFSRPSCSKRRLNL